MSRRKVIVTIFEGGTEVTALSLGLSRCFPDKIVKNLIVRGDILVGSKDASGKVQMTGAKNIVSELEKRILDFIRKSHLHKEDIDRIIHVTDSDGAFILNKNQFEEDNGCGKAIYGDHLIICNSMTFFMKLESSNQMQRLAIVGFVRRPVP